MSVVNSHCSVAERLMKKRAHCKGPFTASEREHECEKDQRTSKGDQRKNFKHQRQFSFPLSLTVNGL